MLAEAVSLATGNARSGQLPFGALAVRDGVVVGRGVNTTLRDHDPSAHAEVAAIRAACRAERTLRLDGVVVYTSCEPCAMCQSVAVQAGIERMVFAASSELAATHGFPAGETATRMQRAWRDACPGFCAAADADRPEAPFEAWHARVPR